MTDSGNRYVLITGATSGIGYELGKLFAQDKYNLIIVARHHQELEKTATDFSHYGVSVISIEKDLSHSEAPFEVYNELKNRGIMVDILVNNAGQANYGFFAETDLQKDLQDIQLNITSMVVLTKLFLQDMVKHNEGKILQLGSVVSVYPAPLQAVYGGTKAFILSFSEALANELKDSNITITTLMPGATDTDFFNKAGAENTRMVQEGNLADPADVAKDGYEALMKGDLKVVSGAKNKTMIGLSNVLPDSVLAAQMRKQSEQSDEKK